MFLYHYHSHYGVTTKNLFTFLPTWYSTNRLNISKSTAMLYDISSRLVLSILHTFQAMFNQLIFLQSALPLFLFKIQFPSCTWLSQVQLEEGLQNQCVWQRAIIILQLITNQIRQHDSQLALEFFAQSHNMNTYADFHFLYLNKIMQKISLHQEIPKCCFLIFFDFTYHCS